MAGSLYPSYNTDMSEVINAGRHEGICRRGSSHTTDDVTLAKYSRGQRSPSLDAKKEVMISSQR